MWTVTLTGQMQDHYKPQGTPAALSHPVHQSVELCESLRFSPLQHPIPQQRSRKRKENGQQSPPSLEEHHSQFFCPELFLFKTLLESIGCLFWALVTVLQWVQGKVRVTLLCPGGSHRLTELALSIPLICSHSNHWTSGPVPGSKLLFFL